jgi:predicted DNA-binding protein
VVLERYALRHDRAGLPQLLKALARKIDKTRVCRVTHEFIQDIIDDIEDIE